MPPRLRCFVFWGAGVLWAAGPFPDPQLGFGGLKPAAVQQGGGGGLCLPTRPCSPRTQHCSLRQYFWGSVQLRGLQNGSSGTGRSHPGSTGTAGGDTWATHPPRHRLCPNPYTWGRPIPPRSLSAAFPGGTGSGTLAISPLPASPRPRGAARCSPKSFVLSGSVSSRKK